MDGRTIPVSAANAAIDATARLFTLDPGLYAVEVVSDNRIAVGGRLILPCAQMEAAPATAGRALFRVLSDLPFASAGEQPAYLRVDEQRTELLLTVYRLAAGMEAPELRITRIKGAAGPAEDAALPSETLSVLAHVEHAGDVRAAGGAWAGRKGSAQAIEGFAIEPQAGVSPGDVEYQAVLGHEWTTPWFEGGEFCGSRGLSLPLLGIRARLKPQAARRYTIQYWGRFVGKDDDVTAKDGALCLSGSVPLEALRVVIRARDVAPARKRRR